MISDVTSKYDGHLLPIFHMDKEVFKHYKLGVDKIDTEHWELIQLMENLLHSPIDEDINNKIQELRTKFYLHCLDEEDYMLSISYPFVDAHTEAHQRISSELETCLKRVAAGHRDKYTTENFIRIFVTHIDHQDLQIVDFINKNRM